MKKIRVGITSGLLPDNSGRFLEYWKIVLNEDYATSVIKSGGIPLILPTLSDVEDIKAQLESIDVLILSGGVDVNPLEYGEEHLPKTGTPDPRRDFYEINLLKLAIEMKIPTLAICRGLQVANVTFGGTLYQDLSYQEGAKLKHDQWSQPSMATQKAIVSEDSLLYKIIGKKEVMINSFHHQTAKALGKDMKITALATDGVVEALEFIDNEAFFLAVQWHPEMMAAQDNEDMLKLFKALIESKK